MPNLETVTLPAGLTGIPKDAFAGSTKLATVKFGTADTNNGGGDAGRAVTGTDNAITLPTGLTTLGTNAFAGTGATTVDLSKITANFTTIDQNVFRGMTKLETVKLPASITTINQSAFQDDAALKTLSTAAPVTSGGNVQVREGEATPGTAKFGSKLTTIGNQAFQGTGFSTVDLSDAGTTSAPSSGRAAAAAAPIPNPLTVGSNAFTNMPELATVKLPANANINPTYFGNPVPAEGATPKLQTIQYGTDSSGTGTGTATATLTDQNISSTNFSKIKNPTIEINSQTNQTINFNGGVFFGNATMTTLKLNVNQASNRNGSAPL